MMSIFLISLQFYSFSQTSNISSDSAKICMIMKFNRIIFGNIFLFLTITIDVILFYHIFKNTINLFWKKHEAIITQPGTFFQLVNEIEELCRVLYIVSPDYLYEKVDNNVVYDDAIVLNEDWKQLSQLNWDPPELLNSNVTTESRQAAYEKIKLKKNEKKARS